jgi:DnaJ-class molecular chaperone
MAKDKPKPPPCELCGGSGKVMGLTCRLCGGSGVSG